MTALTARSSAKTKRPSARETDGAIWFCADGFFARMDSCGEQGTGQQGASPFWSEVSDADDQSAHSQAAGCTAREKEGAGFAAEPAEARCLHSGLYDDAEKAELGAAQGCQGTANQWLCGHR